jgi:DUF1680 family protein
MSEQPASPLVLKTARSPKVRLQSLPLTAVSLQDNFWQPRQQVNRHTTLGGQYQHCETTGRIDNLRRAAGRKDGDFEGWFFNDSDVYKWLEGVAWDLAHEDNADLRQMMDTVIEVIEGAQQANGYINSYFMGERAAQRYTNTDLHELYCAGHLIQAALAHYRVTHSERLLKIAIRFADHICETFGPGDQGKRESSDGHPEIEMALVELYRETGERRYLDQAQFFIDVRGYGKVAPNSFGVFDAQYAQDNLPFRQLGRLYGHAVRALYLNCGATDVYSETGEEALMDALRKQWHNMVERQMYVSGGLGSRWTGEAFGDDYELPNWAYAETCAAIASVMWNWRMLLLEPSSRYSDLIELTLYNGLIAGLSLDGTKYFYQNPLADPTGGHRRSPWFEVSCCPTNLARFLPSLNQYFYSASPSGIWVHLYASNEARIPLSDGRIIHLRQQTNYPWDGDIHLFIDTPGTFDLALRVPAWCQSPSLRINGEDQAIDLQDGYVHLQRTWQTGDQILLSLPMAVRQVLCHPLVSENAGRSAFLRGPLLYCFEQEDNPDAPLSEMVLPLHATVHEQYEDQLLQGVVTLTVEGYRKPTFDWAHQLYLSPMNAVAPVRARAIPYYAWANRSASPMQVWTRFE